MAKARFVTAKESKESVSETSLSIVGSENESEDEAKFSSAPIRVALKTKRELERIVDLISQDGGRKKVKFDSVIRHALAKLKEQDFEDLRSKTVSYGELFDREFQRHKAEHGSVTRDEFLGMVLLGKVKVRTAAMVAK